MLRVLELIADASACALPYLCSILASIAVLSAGLSVSEAADRARPTAVPVLQLGAMNANNEVQSYQDEFMCHKDEWSKSWREEDAGVLEDGRE